MSANRDAMMALRARWKAAGLCSRCGGVRTCIHYKTCAVCREAMPKEQPAPLTASSSSVSAMVH